MKTLTINLHDGYIEIEHGTNAEISMDYTIDEYDEMSEEKVEKLIEYHLS